MPETPAPDVAAAFAIPPEILTDKRGPDLLDHVLDFLRAHPERHDQSVWGRATACGTTACVAGWADLAAGDRPRWIGKRGDLLDPTDPDGHSPDRLDPVENIDAIFVDVTSAEDVHDDGTLAQDRARDLLGLDEEAAGYLFHQRRTFEEIEQYAAVLRAEGNDR